MGDTFQEVVRKVLLAARRGGCGHFTRIPQSRRLGFQGAALTSNYRIDLPVRYKFIGKEYPLAFEAKNEADPTHITDATYRKKRRRSKFAVLIRSALEAQAQPVLVASYIAKRTREHCAQIGIPVYEFGRQFLPSHWKRDIEEKRLIPEDIIGEGFEFVNAGRYLRADREPRGRSLSDVIAFSSDWIDVAHRRWEWMRRRGLLKEVADSLEACDMHEFNRLLRYG
jgi:hypothetical protein